MTKKERTKKYKENSDIGKRYMRIRLAEDYNWLKIAEQTIAVYEKAKRK